MVKNKTIIITIIMIFVLGIVACSQQNTNPPTASPPSSPSVRNQKVNDNVVMINHFVFEPGEITINAGETVTWKHDDSVAHKIVSTDGLFESDVINRGAEFTYTFGKLGEYTYHCSIHPSMTGKIIVK